MTKPLTGLMNIASDTTILAGVRHLRRSYRAQNRHESLLQGLPELKTFRRSTLKASGTKSSEQDSKPTHRMP
jgi:hypothetical protein